MRPSNDHEAMDLIITGIMEKGVVLVHTYDGEEDEDVRTKDEALKILDNLDECFLNVVLPDGVTTGWLRFVMGNEPEEVLCDYTVNLSEFVEPIVDPWWDR